MRTTSIRELHIHTSRVVSEAADGNVIVIARRGVPVAELGPVRASFRMTLAKKTRIFAAMEKIWNRMPPVGDSATMVDEDRNL